MNDSFDISTTEIIEAFREDEYRVTAYDCGKDKVKFCLGIILDETIDIWYCQSVLNTRAWDIGAPYWDDHNMTLYFPDVTIDKEAYEVLNANG